MKDNDDDVASTPSWLGQHSLSLSLCLSSSLCLPLFLSAAGKPDKCVEHAAESAAKIYMHVGKPSRALSLSLTSSLCLSLRGSRSYSLLCLRYSLEPETAQGLLLYLSRLITKFALNHNFQCFTRHLKWRGMAWHEGRGARDDLRLLVVDFALLLPQSQPQPDPQS